jgi:hypothetical protein
MFDSGDHFHRTAAFTAGLDVDIEHTLEPFRQGQARFRGDPDESIGNGCSMGLDFREKGFYSSILCIDIILRS